MRFAGLVAVCAAAGASLVACSSASAGHPTFAPSSRTSVAPSIPALTSTAPLAPAAPSNTTQSDTTAPSDTATPTGPASAAGRLPLRLPTGNAAQILTVTAASAASTTATLQAWHGAPGRWTRVGPAVHAWLGSDGVGRASEQTTTTPAGSFSLTQAFGRLADPGTRLPYRQTTPADWWISQAGPLYNTEQHCASDCPFTQGAPNEHLYYELPYYEYAVVIDYNRTPVRQGAGSAFFLHVTVGAPTQGCVSVARDQLVRILRWLQPSQHPRILIGVG